MFKYFFCPECNRVYSSRLDGELSTLDNDLKFNVFCIYRCICGSNASEIDHGMLNIIQNINRTRLKTTYCCEGHMTNRWGERDYNRAYIAFSDSVTMETFSEIIEKCPLPDGWTIDVLDKDDNDKINVCIRYTAIDNTYENLSDNEFDITKNFYLMELNRWVNNLLIEEGIEIE